MGDTERRLSESGSSSSDESTPSFDRPSFSTSMHNGFDGGKKRQRDDESPEYPSKKINLEADYGATDPAKRMMANMGYKEGVGLGKHGQGRLEPVEASKQKGRRGLGHYNEKLKEAELRWDPAEEKVSIQEEITWLTNNHDPPTARELNSWMGIGPSKKTLDDETLFCDADILSQVIASKSVFDNLDKNEMRRARTRSNPFETIRGAFFLNRAAVKMANMDKACNFMFTKPPTLGDEELLYFADVCAGPGGFSEYVLWRKKWFAKGFGFTLRETNDFKLEDFYSGPPETFHPFYGPKEDGDVYSPQNQEAFKELIMAQTHGEGVHFMMSDGGFSVEGEETIQEILSKQLYLCQCLVALMIVRQGGNFVTKLFDLFTPFSAGLVYIMYRCFGKVSIFKPNTSRPANSERYLICEDKRMNVQDVVEYFARANRVLLKGDKNYDVVELVPYDVLKEDEAFFEYLKNSNDQLGKQQVVGLLKIAAFCEDTSLLEERQADIRKQCLEYWGLPDETRKMPRNVSPEEYLKSITQNSDTKFMSTKAKNLTQSVLNDLRHASYDWFCLVCGSMTDGRKSANNSATFYIGMGRSKTFMYDNGWVAVPELELPRETLVYAEIIYELRGESRSQQKIKALHILDAYILGGKNVSGRDIQDRHKLTKLFAEALRKPTNDRWVRVRAKELHPLANNLEEKMNFKMCKMKNGRPALTHSPSSTNCNAADDDHYYIVPSSILFFKCTALKWSRHMSKSTGYTYYFYPGIKKTLFDRDRPAEAIAKFSESFEKRIVMNLPTDSDLTLEQFFHVVREKCPPPPKR